MATPQLFDVTRDEVLTTRIPALGVRGAALPAYAALDTDGQIMNEAAADIAEALQAGGHGLSPTVNSTDTPVAYYRLRGLLMERVALIYIRIIGQGISAEKAEARWKMHEMRMEAISDGESVGELVVTDGQNRVQFRHGSDSRNDLDNRRFKATTEV